MLKYSSTAIFVIFVKEIAAKNLVDTFIHLPNLVTLNRAIC
jgi:hypothetical protein